MDEGPIVTMRDGRSWRGPTVALLGALTICWFSSSQASAQSAPLGHTDQIGPALGRCWSPPGDLGDVTAVVRLTLRRDGSLMGEPQITFTSPIADAQRLRRLRGSVLQALIDCTPLRVTPELGKALAGHMMLLRLRKASKERSAEVSMCITRPTLSTRCVRAMADGRSGSGDVAG